MLVYTPQDGSRGQRAYRNLNAVGRRDGRAHLRDVCDSVLNITRMPAGFDRELYTVDSIASAGSEDALREDLPNSGTQLA